MDFTTHKIVEGKTGVQVEEGYLIVVSLKKHSSFFVPWVPEPKKNKRRKKKFSFFF